MNYGAAVMHRRVVIAGALVASFLLGRPARAQSGEAALAEARERFREGLELSDAGNDEAARLKFAQAWALFKSPPVLYNLGRAELRSGHRVEALGHLRQFASAGSDTKITEAQREKARGFIAELLTQLGQIRFSAPAGTAIKLDGKPVDDWLREPVAVEPGPHVIEATYADRPKRSEVTCQAGRTAQIDLAWAPDPPGPSVFIAGGDGSNVGAGAGRWIVPGILGVAGLASVAVGVGFGLSSQTAKDRENDYRARFVGVCGSPGNPSQCDTLKGLSSEVDSRGTVALVGYLAGGALLAGAAATFLLWPQRSSAAPRVGVGPVPGGYLFHLEVVQ